MSDSKVSTERSTFPPQIEPSIYGHAGWRAVCSPLALGLLGLAIAVALWGYGSKFWSYFATSGNQPRVPVTRLWIEHRTSPGKFLGCATSPKLNPRAYADTGFVAPVTFSSPELYLHSISGSSFLRERWRAVPFFHTSIPLRSPPSVFFL